jgi:hypothetical protein
LPCHIDQRGVALIVGTLAHWLLAFIRVDIGPFSLNEEKPTGVAGRLGFHLLTGVGALPALRWQKGLAADFVDLACLGRLLAHLDCGDPITIQVALYTSSTRPLHSLACAVTGARIARTATNFRVSTSYVEHDNPCLHRMT